MKLLERLGVNAAMMNYVLDENGMVRPEPDLLAWAKWFSEANRDVKDERVGKARVSTVFMGLNHAFGGGPPILWETMVFGGPLGGEQDRCAGNREQAEAMHERMMKRVRQAMK